MLLKFKVKTGNATYCGPAVLTGVMWVWKQLTERNDRACSFGASDSEMIPQYYIMVDINI